MADLDFSDLVQKMVDAGSESLQDKWPSVRDLATTSIKTLAANLKHIKEAKKDGSITEEQANLLFGMQKNALKTVLLANEGIGLLAAEAAVNAIIDSIKTVVNTAIGFALL